MIAEYCSELGCDLCPRHAGLHKSERLGIEWDRVDVVKRACKHCGHHTSVALNDFFTTVVIP